MKTILFTVLIVSFCSVTFAQNRIEKLSVIQKIDTFKNYANGTELSLKLDTLNIRTVKTNEVAKLWYENNNMPWIISLLISVITIGINIYIARANQSISLKNVTDQIKSSTITSKNQIDSSKEIAIQQIINSQKLAETQFKATLNSKNRQDWINELRHGIAEFLAQCAMISVVIVSEDNENKNIDLQRFFEKTVYHKSKIAMLLNHSKPEQKTVIDLINEMVIISMKSEEDYDATKFKEKELEILKASGILFGLHWGKIKNI